MLDLPVHTCTTTRTDGRWTDRFSCFARVASKSEVCMWFLIGAGTARKGNIKVFSAVDKRLKEHSHITSHDCFLLLLLPLTESKPFQDTSLNPRATKWSAIGWRFQRWSRLAKKPSNRFKNCRVKNPAGARIGNAGSQKLVQKYLHYQQWRRHHQHLPPASPPENMTSLTSFLSSPTMGAAADDHLTHRSPNPTVSTSTCSPASGWLFDIVSSSYLSFWARKSRKKEAKQGRKK